MSKITEPLLKMTLLSDFRVEYNGNVVVHSKNLSQPFTLFTYLLLTRASIHRRSSIIELFWPELRPSSSLSRLRQCVGSLRKSLAEVLGKENVERYLHITKKELQFIPTSPYELDVERLEQLFQKAQEPSIPRRLKIYLYKQALPLLPVPERFEIFSTSEPLEQWFQALREKWLEMASEILAELTQHAMQLKDWKHACELARKHIALKPYFEPAHIQLIRSLYLSKQQDAAKESIERFTNALWQYKKLHPTQTFVDAVSDSEYGKHTRHVLASGSNRSSHRIPRATTPFFGREGELQELRETLISTPQCLCTLCGEGGIGKTRLSMATAKQVASFFPDGTRFIRLEFFEASSEDAPLGQKESVLSGVLTQGEKPEWIRGTGGSLEKKNWLLRTMMDVLGLQSQTNVTLEEEILNHLEDKEMLLIFDNFEHFVELGSFLVRILERAKNVAILVTSRRELGCEQERVVRLKGLQTPSTDTYKQLLDSPAVQLFIECANRRGAQIKPRPEIVMSLAKVCRLVEGMPLAIELAAVWSQKRTLDQLAEGITLHLKDFTTQMRGVPDRHRSIAAAFAYSWSLLSEQERDVLVRCGLFQGGFTLDAARHIIETTQDELERLHHHSLLRKEEDGRYSFHPLLEQFAHQKRLEFEKSSVHHKAQLVLTRQRYNDYYLRTVCKIPQLYSAHELHQWLTAQKAESKNLLHAWTQALQAQEFELLEERVVEFFLMLQRLGLDFTQILRVFEKTAEFLDSNASQELDTPIDPKQSSSQQLLAVRVRAIITHYLLRTECFEQAQQEMTESRQFIERVDDHWARAYHHANLGYIEWHLGQEQSAVEQFQQVATLCEDIPFPVLEALARLELTRLFWDKEDFPLALAELKKALHICFGNGDLQKVLEYASSFAMTTMNTRALEASYQQLQKTMEEAKETHDLLMQIVMLLVISFQALMLHRLDDTLKAVTEANAFDQFIDSESYQAMPLYVKGRWHDAIGQHKEAREHYSRARYYTDQAKDLRNSVNIISAESQAALVLGEVDEAYLLAKQALRLAKRIKELSNMAPAYLAMADYYEHIGEHEKARASYEKAYQMHIKSQVHEGIRFRPLGGMAWANFQMGKHEDALAQAEQMLPFLLGENVYGAQEPIWMYWTVYKILLHNQSELAKTVLVRAKEVLSEMTDGIKDPEHRKSFLERLAWNREIHTLPV